MKKCTNAMGRMAMKIVDAFQAVFGFNKRMKKQVDAHSNGEIEKPVEMLRNLPWLSNLEEQVFQQVMDGFENRQFPEGATLLKEEDPDNGLFVIVDGKVKIEIRGITMDVVGAGSLIGEMAVLTGYPRSASVVAVSPVTVVWIESSTLKSIMKKSVELENGLWEFASMRFAMNLLGKREPYSQWEQNIFIQWLAAGEIKLPNENGWIDLEGKVGVLVTGTAAQHDGSTIVKSPATLIGTDYIFSKEARVYLREK
ncbi:MAG: cyclic nucleotide-binding domain-containing protein [Bacteroidales bacterium]|nr:cyclic nucleotide-binding domain-containing protein [Bacteroidales bacterium]